MEKPIQPDPLVLASASPRRQELLRTAGYRFIAIPSEMPEPEPLHAGETPEAYAEAIAYFKAAGVAAQPQHATATILAADTLCVVSGRILNKPADRADAERMLRLLSGARHRVVTGVTLYHPASGRRMIRHDITHVRFRRLADEQIRTYLASGEWQGKAGGYGLQDRADEFVEGIEGSPTNVVGLPMELVARMLSEWCESAVGPAPAAPARPGGGRAI